MHAFCVTLGAMTTAAPIVSSIRNHTGVIELNRPKAHNSLTPEMIHLIAESLAQWRDNDEVEQVLFTSTSPKAYCAGAMFATPAKGSRRARWMRSMPSLPPNTR